MRIVQFTDTLRSGGRERQLVELLKGLSKMPGVECILITMSENIHYEYVKDFDVKIHYLVRNSQRDPMIFIRLYKLLKEIRPDILHTWCSMTSVYALPVVKLLNIAFVNGFLRDAMPHLSWRNRMWRRARFTFPFSDAVVANSYAGLIAYRAPHNKAHCIHNGFDLGRLKSLSPSEEVRKKYKIPTGRVVGMVASFSDLKDYSSFVKAGQIVMEKRDDVVIVLVGDGPNRKKVESLVPFDLRKKVLFLGKLKDVADIVNIFSVGVLSSTSHGEGISNAIMEYMALQKPVVATDCAGNRELVEGGKTGFLVPLESPTELAEKVLHFLDDPKKAETFGMAGRKKIENEFSHDKLIANHMMLYQEVADKNA